MYQSSRSTSVIQVWLPHQGHLEYLRWWYNLSQDPQDRPIRGDPPNQFHGFRKTFDENEEIYGKPMGTP